MTLRILLADDHPLVRTGMRAMLAELPGVQVVAEARDGGQALQLVRDLKPDLAMLDISMPKLNGLEVAARIRKDAPQTRVVIVSIHSDEEYVQRALAAGAAGYLLKTVDRAELAMAVRALMRGDTWLSPAVSKKVIAGYAGGAGVGARVRPDEPIERLTSRQREVLQLIAEGFSTKEIAARLEVSPKTIETHRTELMDRLGIHGVAGLVRYAIRVGLVHPEE